MVQKQDSYKKESYLGINQDIDFKPKERLKLNDLKRLNRKHQQS